MSSSCCEQQLSVTVLWKAGSKAQDTTLHHHSSLTHTLYLYPPGVGCGEMERISKVECWSCLLLSLTQTHTTNGTLVHQRARHKRVKWILLSHCWQAGGACPHNSSSVQAPGDAVLSSSIPRSANFPRLQTFALLDVTLGSCGTLLELRSG